MSRLPDGRIKFEPGELPPVAMSLASTAWNPTGAWRSREPVFRDLTPPCSAGCPAGQNIADQLRLVAQGRIADAGEVILERNPFPATTGRVCPHPCTAKCNRATMEGPLDVPGVERAIGDALLQSSYAPARKKRNGTRVAVVGAGPAGLTAAHFLAREGFSVTIFDREEKPGGLLWSGIPPWRLPREIADAEIARALEGVELKTGRALGRELTVESLRVGHDAVIVAIGRHVARKLGVRGEERAVDGLSMLRALHRGEPAPAGQRVLVIGGGNTAMDCARSLKRLGRDVRIVYRRGREDMPAFADELEEAQAEGIPLVEHAMPVEVRAGEARFVKTRPTGRGALEALPGSDFALLADLVVAAVGEVAEEIPLPNDVWVCGDLAGGGTVAEAIGMGRKVARGVAQRLGATVAPEPVAEVVAPQRIRPFYFDRMERSRDAAQEARRCLSCGTCTGCDNCFNVCTERAVIRGAPGGYTVDALRCKGCGVCVEECPRGAAALREVGGADAR